MKKNTRIKLVMPEPTLENPHNQIEWIWSLYAQKYRNEKSRQSIMGLFLLYKKFLTQMYGYDERLRKDPRFYLEVHWHQFSVLEAEKYLRSAGYSSASISSVVNCLTNVIDFAVGLGLTSVIDIIRPKITIHRESDSNKAYKDDELSIIRQVISDGTNKVSNLALHYERKGIGKDPRKTRKKKRSKSAWEEWENMVWYFENEMNCQVMSERRSIKVNPPSGHINFFRAASQFHGGIEEVWRKLGVPPVIDFDLLMPLVIKLAWETGLNSTSILNLKRDCFRESHPLTGLPYIRYHKERSTGEKDLHLALFDKKNQSDLHLLYKQSEIIRRTIHLILKLTEPLVSIASPKDKDYLLLVQLHKPERSRESVVRKVDRSILFHWSKSIRMKLKESVPNSNLDILNLTRFRVTKITQMVRDGYDFFHIQAIAGHASVRTTLRYVETHQIMPMAKRELSKTIAQIHKNSQEFMREPKPYATSSTMQKSGVVYKGVMADCKNVFDPPKRLRQTGSYKEGQACNYWNMCLFCPNIIITRRHLPVLVNYANSIKASSEAGSLPQTPNNLHYQKVLVVIEEVLKEFSEEDLLWANNTAESAEFYVDGLVYRGVSYEE